MDVFVETYFMAEHEEAFSEPDEWKKKVAELGLEGQESLMEGDAKSPIPFMAIESDLERVLSAVCPRSQEVTEYNAQPIPMEVLSVIGLAITEKHFDTIEIWSHDTEPDPIVVGKKKIDGNNRQFLLARWGREKTTLADLRKRAIEIWIPKAINKLKAEIKDSEGKLDRIEHLAEMYFNGEYVGIYV